MYRIRCLFPRGLPRRSLVVMVAVVATLGSASAAFAGTITTPTGNPFAVPGDASGNPVAFTVVGSGYTPGSLVSVEQCNGVLPTDPSWSPTSDCDLGSSPSPVVVDATGKATFTATDPNHGFTPFKGESPQSLFNCLSPNGPALQGSNGLPDYRNCQVRVSTSNTTSTADQAFFAIQLPEAATGPKSVGGCSGSVSLVKLSSPVKGVGLTDQTARSVKAAGGLAKDQTTKAIVNGGGSCSGIYRAGDKHVPSPAPGGGSTILSTLTPLSQATSLLGNSGCANGATAQAVDATAADAYPLNGKVTWKFSQTYVDLLTAAPKNFTMQAGVTLLGFNPGLGPDVVDLGGVVLTGVNAGANVGGNIWEDPVAKTGGASGYNTGYELDLAGAAGCADGTSGNANITIVLSGGGGASATSLLGSATTGLTFTTGE